MDALRAAVPLARLLLAVAEAKRDGVVEVRARSRRARVHVLRGVAVALEGVDAAPLGDALLALGALDSARHREALQSEPPEGPVGRWLVHVGAAPESAVVHALEQQLSQRIGRLLGWPEAVFELSPQSVASDAGCAVHVDLARAVWSGLLAIAKELPVGTLAALAGDAPLRLTRTGERLCPLLGLDVDAVLARAPRPEQRPVRAVLRVLHAAADANIDADAYSLLLRKRREIRRRESARALLDLPPTARPDQARRALRRLAHKLHPDRFQSGEPGLRALSGEVMRALSRAEEELRSYPSLRAIRRG